MIPEEAIEAAAKAIWVTARIHKHTEFDELDRYAKEEFIAEARAALDAALPYLTEPSHHPVTDWPDIPRSRK